MRRFRAFVKRRFGGGKSVPQNGTPQQPQQTPAQNPGLPKQPVQPSEPKTQPPLLTDQPGQAPQAPPNEPQPAAQPQPAQQPIGPPGFVPDVFIQSGNTLNIALVNQTASSNVFATVTGRAIDNNNALFLLQADGHTPYLPTNPPAVQTGLSANVAIRLGAPGSTTNLTVPHIAGGRIYFSINNPLTFLLNPGPALVEPSVANPSDPNINTNWSFAEFTFNSAQLYANISYVDFVSSISVALNLTTLSNQTLSVGGLKPNGLDQVASALQAQHATDGQPWDQLIVRGPNARNLRVLSPNLGRVRNPNLFSGYFEPYVKQVYSSYATRPLKIDTQAAFGVVSGTTANTEHLSFTAGAGKTATTNPFSKPSTSDIFSCSTGPFATGSNQETNAIIPRLAAAFNRSTLLKTSSLPAPQDSYYQEGITNHYSRVVHQANVDGRGYAFPYDDVQPSGGRDQSGAVFAGDPRVFSVILSGGPW